MPPPLLTVPILAYHHIALAPAESTSAATYLSPARFARQVALLRRMGFHSVSVADVARALLGQAPLPRRPVVFTFDDGWFDAYEEAWPVLRQAGFRATLFLVGNALGHRGIAFAESREKTPRRLMTIGQIRELAAHGWEIGAHSNSHAHLTRLTETEARSDIEAGRRAIRSLIGVQPNIFCYPYGDFHGGLARGVEDLGFLAACSAVPGRRHRPHERFSLRRVPIPHDMSAWRFLHSILLRQYSHGAHTLKELQTRGWAQKLL